MSVLRPRPLAWLVAVALAAAAPAIAREHRLAPAGALRWLAPADGALLTAGETATFAWEPGPEFSRLGAVHEWEVFLSLDGGRTWAVRLTPHFELSRTSATVRLPDLVSGDARLLLRVGDERIEHEVEVPVHLELRPATGVRLDRLAPARASFERGEPARAGRRGVVLWASGGGSAVAQRWTWFAGEETVSPVRRWRAGRGVPSGALPESPPRSTVAPRVGGAMAPGLPIRSSFGSTLRHERFSALDPLSAGCRRNA